MQQSTLILKLFNKMPLFFKLNFNKIELQVKLSCIFCQLNFFEDIKFYTKFQNRGILVNNFKTYAFYYILFKLGVNGYQIVVRVNTYFPQIVVSWDLVDKNLLFMSIYLLKSQA